MDNQTVNVFAELTKQGPLIMALSVAIWYFYNRQNQLEADAKAQSEKIENLLQEDRKEMLQIIENNTSVMKENTEVLKMLTGSAIKTHFEAIQDEKGGDK